MIFLYIRCLFSQCDDKIIGPPRGLLADMMIMKTDYLCHLFMAFVEHLQVYIIACDHQVISEISSCADVDSIWIFIKKQGVNQ